MEQFSEIRSEFELHAHICRQYGDPERFVGREAELAAIHRYIESDNSAPFLVYGAGGVGKTTLLAHEVLLLEVRDQRVIFRFIGASPKSTDIHSLLNNLCQQAVINYFTGAQMPADYREMLKDFYWWFAVIGKKKQIVIIIDGLDLLSNTNDGPSFDWVTWELPPQVRLILSIREDSPFMGNLMKKIPLKNRLQLSPLPAREREQLPDGWLEVPGKTLQPEPEAASTCIQGIPPEVCLVLHDEGDGEKKSPNRETLQPMDGHCNYIYCAAISADGKRAVSGSQDEPVFVWDVTAGRCSQMLEGHIGRVKAVALTKDGKRAVSAGWDKTLRVWNVEWGEEIKTITAAGDYIDTAAISADGSIAVVGDRGGGLNAWNISKEERIFSAEAHKQAVHAVTLSANGKIAVSAGGDRDIKVWDISTASVKKTFTCRSSKYIRSLALSPDGCFLVSGGDDRTVRTWDIRSGRCLKEMEGHSDAVVSVAISYDRGMAVSTSKDRTIRVWNIGEGICLKVLKRNSHIPAAVALAEDAAIVISAGDDQRVIAWNILDGADAEKENKHDFQLEKSCYSLNGGVRVSGKFTDTLTIDIRAGNNHRHTIKRDDEIKVLNVSPDGGIAITAPFGNLLYLWDTQTGESLGVLQGHSGNITAAVFSLDAARVLSADRHGVIRFWDIQGKTCLNVFPCRAQSLAISADGSFAIAAGDDRVIRVWDTETGACLRKLEGHSGDIRAIALSLYGDVLFSAAGDKTVRVWDIKEGRCIGIKEHHSVISQLAIINGDLMLGDTAGEVTAMTVRNHKLPVVGPEEIREILAKNGDRMLRLTVPPIGQLTQDRNDNNRGKCSVCGKRINLIMAPARGVTDKGLKDCPMHDYCYFFAKPVLPQERYDEKCPHWVSYEVMNFETELERNF
jgi:WD40 repeat protein